MALGRSFSDWQIMPFVFNSAEEVSKNGKRHIFHQFCKRFCQRDMHTRILGSLGHISVCLGFSCRVLANMKY